MQWSLRTRQLSIGARPLVMGIVNVTPDSFSDGGRFFSTNAAIDHALKLAGEGADILDIGGESTRPGSTPVSLTEELDRVISVIGEIAKRGQAPISVDTTKAEVARQAVAAGAEIVNDISAGLADPAMIEVVRSSGAGVVLMHMQGTPATMQDNPTYQDVVREVRKFLEERIEAFTNGGVPLERIAVDPGIGFGKTLEHNLSLLRHLDQISSIGRPVVLGVSRKGMIGQITGRPRGERLVGSVAMAGYCAAHGAAHILRVHDVAATVDAAKIIGAIAEQR